MNLTTTALKAELLRQCNRVIADEATHRLHPSYITKAQGREHRDRMRGAFELAYGTIHLVEQLSDTDAEALLKRRDDALNAANKWL
jgi:hypothetical protein